MAMTEARDVTEQSGKADHCLEAGPDISQEQTKSIISNYIELRTFQRLLLISFANKIP